VHQSGTTQAKNNRQYFFRDFVAPSFGVAEDRGDFALTCRTGLPAKNVSILSRFAQSDVNPTDGRSNTKVAGFIVP
jgi:hypothetical protein